MWKVLPPPYRQEDFFTMRETPPGAVDEGWSGEGSAKESLQIIGGLPTSNIENIDLGWARINVNVAGGKPEIEYVHDTDANVGERSKTVGMGKGQIPIETWEEAKAQGKSYEDFIRAYSGELVGGTRFESETTSVGVVSVREPTRPEVEELSVLEPMAGSTQGLILEPLAVSEPAIESLAISEPILETMVLTEPVLELTLESKPEPEPTEPLPLSGDTAKQVEIVASPPSGTIVYRDESGMYQVAVPPYDEHDRFSTSQRVSGYGGGSISGEGLGVLGVLDTQEEIGVVGEGNGYKTVQVLGGTTPEMRDGVDVGVATVRTVNDDILVMKTDPKEYERGHWSKRQKQFVETKDGLRHVYRQNEFSPAGISKARKEQGVFYQSVPIIEAESGLGEGEGEGERRKKLAEEASGEVITEYPEVTEGEGEIPEEHIVTSDRIREVTSLDEGKLPQALFEGEEVSTIESGIPPNIESGLPSNVEVVPSYIRRKKPKGNIRDWWESDYYEPGPIQASQRRGGDVGITERTYLGHRLLPPELGNSL